jgi:hypothetical protein
LTAYNLFVKAHPEFKKIPNAVQRGKAAGDAWKALEGEEKEKFNQQARDFKVEWQKTHPGGEMDDE